jgi:organic hydroperoxide reductase OsmC/OhrA
MMGTLAKVLAEKKIRTPEENYWADVEGDIENVDKVLKITQIRVNYHLKVPPGKIEDARDALASYLVQCPAAQSVIGCIAIHHDAVIEELKA